MAEETIDKKKPWSLAATLAVAAAFALTALAAYWLGRRDALNTTVPPSPARTGLEPPPTDPAPAPQSMQPILMGDMSLSPSASSPAGTGVDPREAIPAPPQQFQAMAANWAAALSMLDNPALYKNMPPEQAKQIQEMNKTLKEMQSKLASGKRLSEREAMEMTQRMQRLFVDVMRTMARRTAPPGNTDPGGKNKR